MLKTYIPLDDQWVILLRSKIFRMEIQNASTRPSKSNKLRNVNTVRQDFRNITIYPEEINYRKSEVIAFVVNAGMNITGNDCNI